jgi:hypothetical protein
LQREITQCHIFSSWLKKKLSYSPFHRRCSWANQLKKREREKKKPTCRI